MTSVIPRRKNRQPNPLTARLAKRTGCLGGNIAAVAGVMLGPLASWLVIREVSLFFPNITPFYLYMSALALTIGGTLSLPIFITYLAANLTVGYARSPEYPTLCATSLPDSKIVKGFVLAILRYCRGPLILMFGLTPAFGVMMPYLMRLFTSVYYSPWMKYNGVIAQTDLGAPGVVLKYALITLALSLGLFGTNLLATVLGVSFGLWWRSAIPAATAALVTTVGTILTAAYGLYEIGKRLDISDAFLCHFLQYALFAPIPYLIALGCTRLSRRWARKSG